MRLLVYIIAIAVLLFSPHLASATTFSVLANFNSTTGYYPLSGVVNLPPGPGQLILGTDGNFYGTATNGGVLGHGTIFKMTPAGTVTVLVNFDGTTNGAAPLGIMQARDGMFYGTTHYDSSGTPNGTIFQMTTGGTLNTLVNGGATNYPLGFIQGKSPDDNLYGVNTLSTGGVFKVTTAGVLANLATFTGTPNPGTPLDNLAQDSAGNLYGTTLYGGSLNNGSVFKITTGGAVSNLHSLVTSTDGGAPKAGLVLGSDGFLYGAAEYGGTSSKGTIFKITTAGTLTNLVNFDGTTNGGNPRAALIQGSDGNFYGTTTYSKFITTTLSTIFKMTSTGTLTTLVTLPATQTPGKLVQGTDGSFYGTTDVGGTSNLGTAFRLNATTSENVTFNSAATVPITTTAFTITGSALNLSLKFAPAGGALTVINNTGASAINGRFSNLPDGGTINATYNGVTYTFTANYAGGDGNDLTLTLTQASITYQQGGSNAFVTNYSGATDTHLDPSNLDTNFGSALGTFYGPTDVRGLLRFDLTSFAGQYTQITGISLTLNVTQVTGGTEGDLSVYPVSAANSGWVAGTLNGTGSQIGSSTWNNRVYATQNWAGSAGLGTPGTDYDATPLGTVHWSAPVAYVINFSGTPAQLKALVDQWSGPQASNAGLMLRSVLTAGAGSAGFLTSNSTIQSWRPLLTITYSTSAAIAPAITSAASTTFTAGLNGNFSVTATGAPAPTFGATGLPAWASLNSTTGVLGGTPPTTGKSSYPITITATNGTVPDATQNFTLGVIDPFAQWEAQTGFFSPAQIADPTISGPSAIPQKDGYANLLKYLFDINPAQPISYTDRAALPTVAIDTTTTPGTPYLTLTYRQYSLMTGITVNVQTSTNLQSWTTVTPDLSQQVGTDAITGDPIMKVGVKTNGVPKLYIRFNVTMP